MSFQLSSQDIASKRAQDRQKSISIIEDERDLVDIYVHYFTLKNLRILFIAYDGRQAVSMFKDFPLPDVILIDHRMPAMTGIEAMKQMLDANPEARFVFLSADEGIENEAMEAGARAFLKKPASMAKIYDVIMGVMAERS